MAPEKCLQLRRSDEILSETVRDEVESWACVKKAGDAWEAPPCCRELGQKKLEMGTPAKERTPGGLRGAERKPRWLEEQEMRVPVFQEWDRALW